MCAPVQISASGKLVLLHKLLPKLQKEGHKVLIFSQFTMVLDVLEDYLASQSFGYERLDGRVTGNDRQSAIDRFCDPSRDRFVFLLSTKAGGQGINLTAADTVIIFDSDWNPQNDSQATARCHRIGQKKDVKVYRLITRNTYEQQLFERASKKLALEKAVLGQGSMANSKLSVRVPAANTKRVCACDNSRDGVHRRKSWIHCYARARTGCCLVMKTMKLPGCSVKQTSKTCLR